MRRDMRRDMRIVRLGRAALAAALIVAAPSLAGAQTTATGTIAGGRSVLPDEIRERMEVKGSDQGHVGTVDKVQGQSIVLTPDDPDSKGTYHVVQLSSAASVEGNALILKVTAAEAKRSWREAPPPAPDRRR